MSREWGEGRGGGVDRGGLKKKKKKKRRRAEQKMSSRICAGCSQDLPKSEFSKNQWNKKKFHGSRCIMCLEVASSGAGGVIPIQQGLRVRHHGVPRRQHGSTVRTDELMFFFGYEGNSEEEEEYDEDEEEEEDDDEEEEEDEEEGEENEEDSSDDSFAYHKVSIEGDEVWLDKKRNLCWPLEDVLRWRRQPKKKKWKIIAANAARQQLYEALFVDCFCKGSRVLSPCTVNLDKYAAYMKANAQFEGLVRMHKLDSYDFIPLVDGLAPHGAILKQLSGMFENWPPRLEATNPRGGALHFLMQSGCHNEACISDLACERCAKDLAELAIHHARADGAPVSEIRGGGLE